ncbi:antithrombin-III-like [Hippocampus comes]|uniref:antithrombin-III-like n=1 Tax=Hippocampus comes TaxID=109280 RepID=UPI00094E0E09|nr:PREDICTED: antithrombin-III-like [Hippocampus comes]
MASCHWLFLLSVLSLASGRAPEDPCGIKAKDAALEPRCVYRAPEGEPADREDLEASVPRATDRRVWELSVANARFALSLYRRVALGRTADSNVFLSPLGVSAAFSVTKLGACGRTLEEIMKVFEFDSVTGRTSAQVHFYFAKLLCRLQRTKDASTELAVATRLFGDRSLRFDAAYQNISRRVYGAEMMSLDLRGEPEASRGAINAWVANKTENNIRDALPAGAIGADAVLVLVNSIYFKGRWLREFHEEDAYVAPFHVDARRHCSVQMMFQENTFRSARLPAYGLRLGACVLRSGLLDGGGGGGVSVSDAFHKAFLEVNELGSEASASSAAVASGRSIKLDAQVLRADRPFLLLIREKTIDAFLFVGRVARPCRPRAAGPRP